MIGAVAAVPMALNPFGFNAFGPAKYALLALCAFAIALAWALDSARLSDALQTLGASPVAFPAAAVLVLGAMSLAFTMNPWQSVFGTFPEYQGFTLWLLGAVIGIGTLETVRAGKFGTIRRAMVVSGACIGAYAITQLLGADVMRYGSSVILERVRSTLGNASNLGVYSVLVLPFAISCARLDSSRVWRLVGWFATAGLAASLLFTQSRGAWLAAIVAALAWAVFQSAGQSTVSRRRLLMLASVGVLVAAFAVVALMPSAQSRVEKAFDLSRGTVRWRIAIWQASTQMIAANPWLGTGPNSMRYAYPQFRPHDAEIAKRSQNVTGDAHNIIVNAMVSSGVAAGLALAVLWGLALARLWQSRDREGRHGPEVTAAATALVGGFVALMFHFPTLDTLPILAACFGASVALTTRGPEKVEAGRVYGMARAGAWALVAALAFFACVTSSVVVGDMLVKRAALSAQARAPWGVVASHLNAAKRVAPWEPAFVWTEGRFAVSYARQDGSDEVLRDGERSLTSASTRLKGDSGPLFDLGYLRLFAGSERQDARLIRSARDDFTNAIVGDPRNGRYWVGRATANQALGQHEAAIADFKRAVELQFGGKAGWYGLARSYAEIGQRDLAQKATRMGDRAVR